ncbi:MAG: hypothetical protein ABI647_05280 [Gemmatimonadota bacterium]
MTSRILTLGGMLAGLAALAPMSATAQSVQADIRIGGNGPIGGRVIIGQRPRPRGRLVVVDRRRGLPSWLRRDYQYDRRPPLIVVYYDPRDDRYYDEYYDGLEEVRVFDEDGRYYRYDDFDRYYRSEGYRDPRWGRDDRYRDGRWNARVDYRRDDRIRAERERFERERRERERRDRDRDDHGRRPHDDRGRDHDRDRDRDHRRP